MKIIDAYITSEFLKFFCFVMFILAVLFSFFDLLGELDDVGKGGYRLTDAVIVVLLTLPKRLFDLIPVSTLLGGVLALGLMADQGELLAMQAAGISVLRISASVYAAGLLLMVTSGVIAETIVPPMEQKAHKIRAQLISDSDVTLSGTGFWARRGHMYIHVEKVLGDGMAANVRIFDFDTRGRLKHVSQAQHADILDNRHWVLNGVVQHRLTDRGITTTRLAAREMGAFLGADQVRLLEMPPHALAVSDTIRYVRALRQSGQNADRYLLSLWRKASIPLTTGAMALLSLGVIFGSTRNMSAGRRITLGSLIGVVLYVADQLIMNIGLLLDWPPLVTAMLPFVLISGAATWRLRGAGYAP